jgi:hypothetical protein
MAVGLHEEGACQPGGDQRVVAEAEWAEHRFGHQVDRRDEEATASTSNPSLPRLNTG